jgi:hypothetical protein
MVRSTLFVSINYFYFALTPVPPSNWWQWALCFAYIASAQVAQITLAIGFKYEGAALHL